MDSDLHEAFCLAGAGNVAAAVNSLHKILRGDPGNGSALHLMGKLALQQKELPVALDYLERATQADADNAAFLATYAGAFRSAGRLDAALDAAQSAVQLDPELGDARNQLGLIHMDRDDLGEAHQNFENLTVRIPGFTKGWCNLGNVLRLQEKFDGAEAALRRAIALRPDYPIALNILGVVLGDLSRDDEAVETLEKAQRLSPEDPKILSNLGRAWLNAHQPEKAERCVRNALRLNPGYIDGWINLGALALEANDVVEGRKALDAAMKLSPDRVDHLRRLGNLLAKAWLPERAIACFDRALERDPDSLNLRIDRDMACLRACRWDDPDGEQFEETVRRVREKLDAGELPELSPTTAWYLPFDSQDQLRIAEHFAANLESIAARVEGPPVLNIENNRRVRIGYLSPDFRNHAVAHLTRRLYVTHDRKKFEVFGYSIGPDDGSVYRRDIEAGCDTFHDCHRWPVSRIVEQIRDRDEIDILVDLAGYTERCRPQVLAHRSAPIQVAWIEPHTMGVSFVDYFITDKIATPRSQQKHFSERLVFMPDSYMITDDTQEISETATARADWGLPDEGFVFCAFCRSNKISPPVFAAWMRILERVEGSVLWLQEPNEDAVPNLQREAGVRGIDSGRLIFAKHADTKADHLRRIQLAGLYLDTHPNSAHTTACDALWTGVPVLTWPGPTMAGRGATSALHAAGLSKLVVKNLDAYESLAIEIANDAERHQKITDKLSRNRQSRPLFQTERFVRHLETAYTRMIRNEGAAKPAAMLTIASHKR